MSLNAKAADYHSIIFFNTQPIMMDSGPMDYPTDSEGWFMMMDLFMKDVLLMAQLNAEMPFLSSQMDRSTKVLWKEIRQMGKVF